MRERKRIFVICPVRNVHWRHKEYISDYVTELESEGHEVHCPLWDTDQDDAVGLRICDDNTAAVRWAEEVHAFYHPNSSGSLFDTGATHVLRKPLRLINPEMVAPTEGKSFANVLLVLDDKYWRGEQNKPSIYKRAS